MDITVHVQNIKVTRPLQVHLKDRSGAHTELTVFIPGQPPIAQSFDYTTGDFTALVDPIDPGVYTCRFFIQAYDYKAMNPMFDVSALVNAQLVASAKGNIPAGGSDAGLGDFTLTVV